MTRSRQSNRTIRTWEKALAPKNASRAVVPLGSPPSEGGRSRRLAGGPAVPLQPASPVAGILDVKLHPPPEKAGVIRRERLLRVLADSRGTSVVAVVAPLG